MNEKCRALAKIYFQCRMDNGLMEKDDWEHLGYADVDVTKSWRWDSMVPYEVVHCLNFLNLYKSMFLLLFFDSMHHYWCIFAL